MPLIDFPEGAQLDPPAGMLADLPANAQLDATQNNSAWRLPAMAGSNLAKGAAEGVGVIGSIDDLLKRGFDQAIFNPLHTAITGRAPSNPANLTTGSPMSSENLVGALQSAGVANRPDLQPQTTPERYLAAASEGAGGMLPALPLGGGAALPNLLRAGTMGAAGGAAGEGAAELFPNHPMLARLAGNVLGSIGSGAMMNTGARANAAIGGTSPTLQAYRDLGVEPTLGGDVSGTPFMQMVQAYASRSPGGAGRIHDASQRAVQQWGGALEDTAASLGGAQSVQDVGNALQSNAKNWLNQFRADSQKAWNQLDVFVPQNTPVPAQNYAMTLSAVRNQMPGAPATAETLQPALSRNLLDSLARDIQSGPLTWQDVKGIRTRIGEMLSNPQIVADTSHADLKRIYGALTTDLGNTVAAKGPLAQQAFTDANALTRNGHDFIDNVLSNVVRGNQVAPEQAARSILNTGGTGGTTLQAIRQEMPQAADEIAAFKLRDMAQANPGQQNAAGTRLSPGTFVTQQNQMSPEAVNALFAHDPVLMQKLRDLSTVAGSMKETERFLNTSGTGVHGSTGHAVSSIIGSPIAALEGYHQAGLPGALAGALAPPALAFGPSFLAGRIATNPFLARMAGAAPTAIPGSSALLNRAALAPLLNAAAGLR